VRGRLWSSFAATLIAVLFTFATQALAEGKRVALVIGNGAYQSVPALPNPRNDAALVATALRKQGFEVVTALDLTRAELEQAVERYARSLNGADISLFYYSGHGIEVGGENRLIPIDATLAEPQDLETQTFSLQTIMLYMQSNSKAQLIYLDACRNNPFSDRTFLAGIEDEETKAGKGLAEFKGGIGSLIAYAASPGQEALDGEGANSPFTTSVMKHSFVQGLDVQNALMKVTEDVWNATNQSQRPWVNSTLVKPVFLNGLLVKTLAPNMPDVKVEIKSSAPVHEIQTGPYILGAGAQPAFVGETEYNVPVADAYKVMRLPQSGTVYAGNEVLGEGTLLDKTAFASLKYEPSTAEVAPSATLGLAAISKTGSGVAMNVLLPLIFDDCDLLAGEPLDLQGVGKGIEFEAMNGTRAVDACIRATAAHADTARFTYQLGRAKLASGESAEAVSLFKQAADAGHIRATYALGDLTLRGIGMSKNPAEANALFQQAADKGDPLALFMLGRNLVKGIGAKADAKQGITLLKRSAEMGNTDALDEIGSLYLYGQTVKTNPRRAAKFLEASVTRSVAKSKRRKSPAAIEQPNMATDLGAAYYNGKGLTRDLRQAIKWYELGAERGNQGGVADLSWIYSEGPDGLRNPTRAVWFTSLALGTDGFRGDADMLRRLASLPDGAKREAMRDFVNLVGPCASATTDGLDDTLQLLSNKTWLLRQADDDALKLPENDGSFASPDGTTAADELRYWNLVNGDNGDQAYLAYLKNFPDGVFSEIAKRRLGGLLERVNVQPKEPNCEPPAPPVKLKKPIRKVEPVKLREPPPKVNKVEPKRPPPVVKQKPKPKPVAEKPKRKPDPPVKRPRRPRVVIEEEPEFEEEEPEFEIPRRKIRLRFPRIPRQEQPRGETLCDGIC
jgi:TPR repeat protein